MKTQEDLVTFDVVMEEDTENNVYYARAYKEGIRVPGIVFGGSSSFNPTDKVGNRVSAICDLAGEVAYRYKNFKLIYENEGKVVCEVIVRGGE